MQFVKPLTTFVLLVLVQLAVMHEVEAAVIQGDGSGCRTASGTDDVLRKFLPAEIWLSTC
jgi:hypothetical protein